MMKKKAGKYIRQKQPNAKPFKIVAVTLGVLAAIMILLAIATGVFVWYTSSVRGGMFAARDTLSDQIAETEPSNPPAPSEAPTEDAAPIDADWIDEDGNAYNYRDDIISILLMGVDYMGDSSHWTDEMISNGGNADIMGLVILDPATFEFSIFYIPRDTMTEVIAMDADGKYIDTVFTNICVSHSYGDGKALSCQLSVDAVSRLLFNIPINRYAALDFYALDTLNEILGGLEITFDQDYTDINPAYIKGSSTTMDGAAMQRFIRYRNRQQVDGAYDRGVRSMFILKSMFNQCKAEIAANPTVALDFWNGLSSYITTDLDLSEVSFLAQNIGKMDFSSDTVIKLPGEVKTGEWYAEFYPDEQWLHDFVVSTFCVPAE